MPIKLDKQNSRKHSDRNKSAIRKSLETVGAFRSVGMDADEIMRVGNGVYTEAQALGIPVRIVESDGTELIVVKRTDLQGEKAVQAATLDNLTADTSAFEYDADRLREALANDSVSKAIAESRDELRALLQVNAPIVGEWGDVNLPDGDRAPFQQMTFTVHDTQAEQIKEALSLSKSKGDFVDSPNENSNGNALARICETYITQNG